MNDSILTTIGRIMMFAMPTIITYGSICYSPVLSGKLIGTATQDFVTNLLLGLIWSFRTVQYDNIFIAFVFILLFIMIFIKMHCSHVFMLQLAEKPVEKNFKESMKRSLGSPPVVRFVSYRTPSAPSSAESSRELSPVEYEYGSWQDLTPLPEVKYSQCLRVTTATNCCFTERAKRDIELRQEELRKRIGPHRDIITSVSCNECPDYFVTNTSGKRSNILKMLRSKPAVYLYYFLSFIGYKLWFEFLYYRESKELKVQLYKCIGVEEDNLRARKGEVDSEAQNNFAMFMNATDKEGPLNHC